MALEDELQQKILTLCPQSFAVTADHGVQPPYCVWQRAGGKPVTTFDNSLPDIRNAFIQITVWHTTSKAATDLLASIAQLLCTPTATWTASAMGEPVDAYDDADELLGVIQTFNVWGQR